MPVQIPAQRDTLRRRLRRERAALVDGRVRSDEVCRQIAALPEFLESQHVAVYLAVGSEVNLQLLIDTAGDRHLYLPRVQEETMELVAWHPGQPLERSSVGTAQPAGDQPRRNVQQLDLVLLPLLGFDDRGNRLGQGGGYYDRTFSFMLASSLESPRLWGVGFECQRVSSIVAESWDVPLHGAVTEHGVYRFR